MSIKKVGRILSIVTLISVVTAIAMAFFAFYFTKNKMHLMEVGIFLIVLIVVIKVRI